jgi:DNA-binding NarL/FixJ family response regulator
VPCTVLIVDDHDDFRRTARALLEAAGFEVVGEAVDGESAVIARPARLLSTAFSTAGWRSMRL